jgi:hypothetical protein
MFDRGEGTEDHGHRWDGGQRQSSLAPLGDQICGLSGGIRRVAEVRTESAAWFDLRVQLNCPFRVVQSRCPASPSRGRTTRHWRQSHLSRTLHPNCASTRAARSLVSSGQVSFLDDSPPRYLRPRRRRTDHLTDATAERHASLRSHKRI